MKADMPDKIYLPKVEIEERMPWITNQCEDDPNWDECYIRKKNLSDELKIMYVVEILVRYLNSM